MSIAFSFISFFSVEYKSNILSVHSHLLNFLVLSNIQSKYLAEK